MHTWPRLPVHTYCTDPYLLILEGVKISDRVKESKSEDRNKQKKFNRNIEYKIHQNAFKTLKTKLKKKYPKIKLETKIMTVKTLFLTVAMNEII